MLLITRLGCFAFWLMMIGAILSAWDVHAEQPAGTPAETSVNRVRKWLGRTPRGMPANQVGKNHDLVRKAFRNSIREVNKSTVRVMTGNTQIALGTVVRSDGLILTKASELKRKLSCKIPGHGTVSAKAIGTNKSLDLALLQVEISGLPAIRFEETSDGSPRPLSVPIGTWVATPSGFGELPLVVGVVGGIQRRISKDSPVIGISIEDSDQGVIIRQVVPGSGAEDVGIEETDVVVRIDGVSVNNSDDLMRVVKNSQPGKKVHIIVKRGKRQLEFSPRLGRRTDLGMAEQGLLAHEGGPLSQRRSGFPVAIQHDSLIEPNQCGGPLVDIDGNVVGLNIARAGRAASYSLPSETVQRAWKNMMAQAVSSQ